jgi:hypothetical protein
MIEAASVALRAFATFLLPFARSHHTVGLLPRSDLDRP